MVYQRLMRGVTVFFIAIGITKISEGRSPALFVAKILGIYK
jgi:hypothetical protein